MVGKKVGPYEIIAKLGAGGMGEVYRARDTKLDRDVALKILPESFAGDPDRLMRFEREAKTLASLNHPNIAAIYGIEERALVMELVEGEDLSQRLARGPIPLDDALPIAIQIADALDAAHEQGIIHRDLKPANIKVRADGTVKVLDFGLAKAMDPIAGVRDFSPAGSIDDQPNPPTITSPAMTMRGVILGTAAYMAPEQARGRMVDRRADIWSFGVVLYEMLCGRRAFHGEDVSITLANVLKEDVKWEALPSALPASLGRLLRRCLEKDPKRRLRDIGEARFILEEPDGVDGAIAPSRTVVPWIAAGVFLIATIALAIPYLQTPASPAVVRLQLALPRGGQQFNRSNLAVSPNGRYVVMVVQTGFSDSLLYLHTFETGETRPLPGTEDGVAPFWSPDGQSVGFFSNGLKRVDLAGGTVRTVGAAVGPSTGTWNASGTIVFSSGNPSGLYRVSADGGTPVPIKGPDASRGDVALMAPHFLPDGVHFLYSLLSKSQESQGTYVGSLESATVTRVLATDGKAQFAPPDHLLFIRDEALFIQSFDPRTWRAAGEPVRIADNLPTASGVGANRRAGFSVSENGVLALIPDARSSVNGLDLAWYGRTGQLIAQVGRANYRGFELSPDRKSLAAHRHTDTPEGGDLWITDLERGTDRRFTFDASQDASSPIWSPDGKTIAFAAERRGQWGIYRKPADGTGADELLFESESVKIPYTWAPDGKSLVFANIGDRSELWILPLSTDRKPAVYLRTERSRLTFPQISPDGRWIAYGSAGGAWVESYPTPGTKYQAASGGQVRWRADGKELFVLQGLGEQTSLVSVAVDTNGAALRFGPETPLPLTGFANLPHRPGLNHFTFDVSADGQMFLLPRVPTGTGVLEGMSQVQVILNWPSLLDKKP